MAALTTGIAAHRDQTAAEKAAGVTPDEVVITGAEIMAMVNAIDNHAPLIDQLQAIVDALPAINDEGTGSDDVWSAEKIAEELANNAPDISAQLDPINAKLLTDDTDYNTLQKITAIIKALDTAKADESDLTELSDAVDNLPVTGIAATIYLDEDSTLTLPVSPYHTQPYVIDSSGTATGSDGYGDYVSHIVPDPTAAGQRITVDRNGDKNILLVGTIDGEPDGVIHNRNKATIILDSGDGTGGWTMFTAG